MGLGDGIFNHQERHPRESGDPVRRGLSIQSLMSLEYWIPAFAGMTTGCDFAISRRIAPEVRTRDLALSK